MDPTRGEGEKKRGRRWRERRRKRGEDEKSRESGEEGLAAKERASRRERRMIVDEGVGGGIVLEAAKVHG